MSRDRPESTASPSPSVGEAPDPRRWRALAVCLVAGFMTLLDVSIVNVALPSIREAVGASSSELQWVVSGYALTFGLVLVPAGRLGDMRGRRTMFIVGVAVFTLSSLLAGLAPTALLLVVARLVQGVGGGLLNPQVSGLIQELFRGANAAGPSACSAPSSASPPRWGRCSVGCSSGARRPRPAGAGSSSSTSRSASPPSPCRCGCCPAPHPAPGASGRDLDLVGVGLLGAGVLAVLFPLVQEQQWPGNGKWALLAVGVGLLGAFVAWERRYACRGREPLVDLTLFSAPRLRPGRHPGPDLLRRLHRHLLRPHPVLPDRPRLLRAARRAGRHPVRRRLGGHGRRRGSLRDPRRPADGVLGLLLVVVGLVLTDLVLALHGDEHAAGWWTAAPLLVAGIGSGLVISPNQTLTLANVPVQRAGSAGGVIQTGQRLGTAAGIALVGSVYFGTLSSSHGDDAQAAGHGLRVAVALTAVALVVGVVDVLRTRAADRA